MMQKRALRKTRKLYDAKIGKGKIKMHNTVQSEHF